MVELTKCALENSQIITDLITRIVNKYRTIIVINDCNDNMATVYAFIDKLGYKDVNILSGDTDFCKTKHGLSNINASCRVNTRFAIRASSLGIYPCTRAFDYDHLMFAQIDCATLQLIPNNIELALALYLYNPQFSNVKCDRCKYNLLCHKSCYIDNYVINRDFFQPVWDNCEIYKQEIDDMIKDNPYLSRYLIESDSVVLLVAYRVYSI